MLPNLPRYALHPGYVWSNGLKTFLPSATLAEKYHLPAGSWLTWLGCEGRAEWDAFIHLYPRNDGDYEAALAAAHHQAGRP